MNTILNTVLFSALAAHVTAHVFASQYENHSDHFVLLSPSPEHMFSLHDMGPVVFTVYCSHHHRVSHAMFMPTLTDRYLMPFVLAQSSILFVSINA
jgi:hypothetical protein